MGKKTKSVNNKQSTGIDFIRAKKKVGRKIRKQANETNTEVRAKRINLSVQSLGTEGKGDQVTGRGLSMPELLNQCQHYSARVRKDALDGIKELLETHPTSLVPCAATCVEKVAESLVDQEQIVRAAATNNPKPVTTTHTMTAMSTEDAEQRRRDRLEHAISHDEGRARVLIPPRHQAVAHARLQNDPVRERPDRPGRHGPRALAVWAHKVRQRATRAETRGGHEHHHTCEAV